MNRKRMYLIMVPVLFLILLAAWWAGFHRVKRLDNLPTKELAYQGLTGEIDYDPPLEGYTRKQLTEIWGEPDGGLFGMFGDVWEVKEKEWIIVYYDGDGIVENVKIRTGE